MEIFWTRSAWVRPLFCLHWIRSPWQMAMFGADKVISLRQNQSMPFISTHDRHHTYRIQKKIIPHAQIVTGCMQTSYIHVSTQCCAVSTPPVFQFPWKQFFFALNLTVQTLDRGHYCSVEKKLGKPKFVHFLICLGRNTETRIARFHNLLNISFHMRGPPAQCRCRVATMHGHRTMMMMTMETVTTPLIKEIITAQTVATIVKGKTINSQNFWFNSSLKAFANLTFFLWNPFHRCKPSQLRTDENEPLLHLQSFN